MLGEIAHTRPVSVVGSSTAAAASTPLALRTAYLVALKAIERSHRQLLDVIKDEFDRTGRTDINAVQALLLFNIGDHELTAGEIRSRGCYQGSNASYNLKKLVESGYIDHQRSTTDRRSVRVRLTPAGKAISTIIDRLIERQLGMFEKIAGISLGELGQLNQTLARLERFWGDQVRYRL